MAPQPLHARGSQAGPHPGGLAQGEDLDLRQSCPCSLGLVFMGEFRLLASISADLDASCKEGAEGVWVQFCPSAFLLGT